MTDIETVMLALVEHVRANVPEFVTCSRRTKHWQQCTEQPAFFLRRIGMHDEYNGTLPIRTLDCEAWIYSNAGEDPDKAPDEALTRLEQALRACLAPDDDTRFTLRGLVYWCRIEGKSDVSPGDQTAQSIARIPIRITLP